VRRSLAIGAVSGLRGPRPSFDDGWDLATRWILLGSLRLCASALIVMVTGFALLRLRGFALRRGWICDAFVSSCLRVWDVSGRLCFSVRSVPLVRQAKPGQSCWMKGVSHVNCSFAHVAEGAAS
jgi:uncharacterized membrane protein